MKWFKEIGEPDWLGGNVRHGPEMWRIQWTSLSKESDEHQHSRFWAIVDRIKYGDTEALEFVQAQFGREAMAVAQNCLDRFWGRVATGWLAG